MHAVTVYSKPGCLLCDEAMEQVELARREMAFAVSEVNILSDPTLYDRYKFEIPVIAVNGRDVFRHRLTAAELLDVLGKTCG